MATIKFQNSEIESDVFKKGHYWIKDENDNLYTSFWNGQNFIHDGESHLPHQDHVVIEEIIPQCQTGCDCKQNSDGTWKIIC